MDDEQRAEYEKELAIAVMLLWIFFDTSSKSLAIDYPTFKRAFDEHVRPILSKIYGTARKTLADRFGVSYPEKLAAGGGVVVQLPNLGYTIDGFAQDLYGRWVTRWTGREEPQRQDSGVATPVFDDRDAEREAVNHVTDATSRGEFDARADVESRTGKRLMAYWKTEPGACKKICAPLEGQPERVWRPLFPFGPKAHPHCRCRLIWRLFLG